MGCVRIRADALPQLSALRIRRRHSSGVEHAARQGGQAQEDGDSRNEGGTARDGDRVRNGPPWGGVGAHAGSVQPGVPVVQSFKNPQSLQPGGFQLRSGKILPFAVDRGECCAYTTSVWRALRSISGKPARHGHLGPPRTRPASRADSRPSPAQFCRPLQGRRRVQGKVAGPAGFAPGGADFRPGEPVPRRPPGLPSPKNPRRGNPPWHATVFPNPSS